MTHSSIRSLLTACALSTLSVSLWAQNLAIVNGKAVPKARAEVLAEVPPLPFRPDVSRMAGVVKRMVREGLDALIRRDADLALKVTPVFSYSARLAETWFWNHCWDASSR